MIEDIYKIHIKEINFESSVFNYYFDNLIKAKKTKSILIDKKNCKDMVIYFTR